MNFAFIIKAPTGFLYGILVVFFFLQATMSVYASETNMPYGAVKELPVEKKYHQASADGSAESQNDAPKLEFQVNTEVGTLEQLMSTISYVNNNDSWEPLWNWGSGILNEQNGIKVFSFEDLSDNRRGGAFGRFFTNDGSFNDNFASSQALTSGQILNLNISGENSFGRVGIEDGGFPGRIGFSIKTGEFLDSGGDGATNKATADNRFRLEFVGGQGSARFVAANTVNSGMPGFDAFKSGQTYRLEVISENEFNLQVVSGTRYNIESFGGSGQLNSLVIFNIGANMDALFTDLTVEQPGTIQLQANDFETRTITGLISDITNTGNGSIVNSIVKEGNGTVILNVQNTFTGNVSINAGVLQTNVANAMENSGTLILNGGTFATNGFAQQLGTLDVASNSIINLGANPHNITFSDATASWSGTLLIDGWTGAGGTSGSGNNGRIFIGDSNDTLSEDQLENITFAGFPTGATLTADGELVPLTMIVNANNSGDWENSATWNTGIVPGQNDFVTISSGQTVTITSQNASATRLLIEENGVLEFSEGPSRAFTLQNGGLLQIASDGSFNTENGVVEFAGEAEINGAISFHNLRINGPVNFGSGSQITGSLRLLSGNASVTINPPFFSENSELIFDTGGTYPILFDNLLWQSGTETGAAVPNNVRVVSTNPLQIFAGRTVPGSLFIEENGGVIQGRNDFIIGNDMFIEGTFAHVNDGNVPLIVNRDINILPGGSLTLSDIIGGDLRIRGNWTNAGTFNAGQRAVFFDGSEPQTITNGGENGISIPFLFIQNDVRAMSNLTVREELDLVDNVTLTIGSGNSIITPAQGVNYGDNGMGLLRFERDLTDHTRWVSFTGPISGMPFAGSNGLFSELYTQGFPGSDDPAASGANIIWYDETRSGNNDQRFVAPSQNELVPGRGYFLYVFERKDRDDPLSALQFPFTFNSSGQEHPLPDSGRFTFPISFTSGAGNGWNLVGNPWGASIDWSGSEWTKTNMHAFAYIYDPSIPGYLVTDADGDNDLIEGVLNSPIISPFQAFFVRAENSDAILQVGPEVRTISNPNAGLFSTEPQPVFSLQLDAGNHSSTTAFRFGENYRNSFGPADAHFLSPMASSFTYTYSLKSGRAVLLNSLPVPETQPITIPLAAGAFDDYQFYNGEAVFSWPVFRNIPDHWEVSLVDQKIGITTNMKEEDSYSFVMSATSATSSQINHFSEMMLEDSPEINPLFTGQRFRVIVDASLPVNTGGESELPQSLTLSQNYPNPFNPVTRIPYALPQAGDVLIEVFNITGQRVAVIENGFRPAGFHTAVFDGRNFASGIYIYKLQSGGKTLTQKMSLIK
ncbi:MAG: T9SS type A sorting domain-containing protein [Balneolales bacterium]|nr:T9SS type A sorting domain-containing protein [Balneolales bacterium]